MTGRKFTIQGTPMVEGHSFNWEEDVASSSLKIVVGSVYNMRTCVYGINDHKLIITTLSNESQVPFFAQGLADAEKIVTALQKGIGCTTLPLYKK